MSKTDQPDRNLDDSWALSASMPVPRVDGVDDDGEERTATAHGDGHNENRSDTLHDGHPASAVAELLAQPAPPRIPAAAPSGPGTGHEAAASVVARGAALRALGAKTMQGFGPAPINKPRDGQPAGPMMTPSRLQEAGTAFDPSAAASTFEAATMADDRPRPALDTPAPMKAAEAPLYLDDPPHVLRLSTNTSDHAVAAIDPGASASMNAGAASSLVAGAQHAVAPANSSYPDESGEYASDQPAYDGPPEEEEPDDPSSYTEEQPNYSGEHANQAALQASYGQPAFSGEHIQDSGEYVHSAPEAPPPVAQLVAASGAVRRPYTNGESGRVESESEWFEPSAAQPMSDPAHLGHNHSFTEPSRRHRPPVPNRWIAPVAVFIAVSAVVFAGGYFYYRSQPAAPIGAAPPPSGEPPAYEPATAAVAAGAAGSGESQPVATGSGSSADEPAAPAGGIAPGLIDVRFDSTPPGAMVMLVDRERGVTSPVGTTPVRTALDPKVAYDAIFTLEGHPTKVVSLDASKSPRVLADLTGAASSATTAGVTPTPATASGEPSGAQPAETSAQVAKPSAPEEPARNTGRKRPRRDKERDKPNQREEAEAPDAPTEVNAAAMGSLTISAKPPCEVSINGKSLGRMTPVRELPVTAGIYKITLTNKSLGVNETIAVRVTPGKETKVTQDYTGAP